MQVEREGSESGKNQARCSQCDRRNQGKASVKKIKGAQKSHAETYYLVTKLKKKMIFKGVWRAINLNAFKSFSRT